MALPAEIHDDDDDDDTHESLARQIIISFFFLTRLTKNDRAGEGGGQEAVTGTQFLWSQESKVQDGTVMIVILVNGMPGPGDPEHLIRIL